MKDEIKFLSGGVEGVEVLRLSKEGIWANPDVPVDEAAGYVLKVLDAYIKKLVDEAVKAEREACALIAENGLLGPTIAKAIRARGESK